MASIPAGAPFDERGGRLRGVLDLATGHYPAFLFGLPLGRLLPVFHFHETSAEALEPAFRYLAENGYRTVTSEAVAQLVRGGSHPGPRTVMLAFDDAWASLWMVVLPLLERYDLSAVTYAIPGRIQDAAVTRPNGPEAAAEVAAIEASEHPFVTWPELRALSASGRVDVQSHTWSHAMIFTGDRAARVVDREYGHEPVLIRPRLDATGSPEFLPGSRFGYPLFARRSRMSDGRRFWPDQDACQRLEAFVAGRGGPAFFERPGWRADVAPLLGAVGGRWETDAERTGEIERELADARDALEGRLQAPVRHICLPWGVSGTVTREALARLGVVTAFANRLSGRLAVAAGDDPFFLKRLPNRYIFALPGHGRRPFWGQILN